MELQLPVENGTVSVQLQYIRLHNQYLPLYLRGEEGNGIPDSSFSVLADKRLVIGYAQEAFQNAYLIDPETAEVQSIGDLSYAYAAEAAAGRHIYANTVQSSTSGRFLLYRTYALHRGGQRKKQKRNGCCWTGKKIPAACWIRSNYLAICWEMSCVWLEIPASLLQRAKRWMIRPKLFIRSYMITVKIHGQNTGTTNVQFPM